MISNLLGILAWLQREVSFRQCEGVPGVRAPVALK